MNETEIDDLQDDSSTAESPDAEVEAVATQQGTRLILKRAGVETEITFGFTPPATIGRFDPSVGPIDIDLGTVEEGTFVSRKHAKIILEDDVYKILDLGSSNGTFVLRDDFEKVDEAEIKDGDEIALGNARFVFRT